MKQLLQILLTLCLVLGFSATEAQNNLKGRWLHVDDAGDSAVVELKNKNLLSIYLIFMGAIDSSEFFVTGAGNEFGESDEDEDEEGGSMLVDAKYKTSKTYKNHLYFVLYHAGTNKPYLIYPLLYSQPSPDKLVLTISEEYSDFMDGVLYTDESSWKKAEDILLNMTPENVEEVEFVRW